MNVMHHMFCRITNCNFKKLSANENKQPNEMTSTPINILHFYTVDNKKNSKYVTDIIFWCFIGNFLKNKC